MSETGWTGIRGVPDHGIRGRYARGCRCDECRAYNAAMSRKYRELNRKPRGQRSDKGVRKVVLRPEDHGTTNAYAYHRCRCSKCRAAAAEYNRKWRADNRDRSVVYMRDYLHARRALGSPDQEAREYAAIIAGDPCAYCGDPSASVDHIDPIVRSRNHSWDNLAPACGSCNSSKGAKTLLEFLLYRAA